VGVGIAENGRAQGPELQQSGHEARSGEETGQSAVSKKRKIILAVAGAGGGVTIFLIVRMFVHLMLLPGVYLAHGGLCCVVIERQGTGWHIGKEYLTEIAEHHISSVWPRLKMAGESTNPEWSSFYGDIYVLAPSWRRFGDWDLVRYGDRFLGLPNPPTPPGKNWIRTFLEKALSRLKRSLSSQKSSTTSSASTATLTTTQPREPVPVFPLTRRLPFLHRLNDLRIVDYFDQQYSSKDRPGAYRTAKVLLASHPGDLNVRSLYLMAAAYCDDTTEVARRLDEWKDGFERQGDPFLKSSLWVTERWLCGRQLSAARKNAYDFCEEVLGEKTDLATRLRLLPSVFDYEMFVPPYLPNAYSMIPNYLEIQVTAKVFRALAIMRMIEGKRDESLQILAATYHLGQTLMTGKVFLPVLIGIAIKGIACAGLEVYALNCCETEAEFQRLWQVLERLEKNQSKPALAEILSHELTLQQYLPTEVGGDPREAEARANVVDGRFELIRSATAAKYRMVSTGEFPKSNAEFGPFLPQGPPKDPFSDGPMRFLSTTDSLICYSIGPDRRDNHARIEYDPTNGTFSAGDLWVKVPRQRQYPFPREGLRAASEDDIWRKFPNGLPPDPFASTKGRPLSTTTSVSGEIYIYSFGPDVDEFKDGVAVYPVSSYPDPASTENIVFFPAGAFTTVTVTLAPSVSTATTSETTAFLLRKLVGLFMSPATSAPLPTTVVTTVPLPHNYALPPGTTAFPTYVHVLEHAYDPTNGIRSEGDIFMRVPRP
jgi:hypothetical protein